MTKVEKLIMDLTCVIKSMRDHPTEWKLGGELPLAESLVCELLDMAEIAKEDAELNQKDFEE